MINKKIFGVVDKIDDSLYKIEKLLLCSLLIAMIVLAFASVVMRLFFNMYFAGIIDILQNMVLWCTFLGATIATRTNEHLSINVLYPFIDRSRYKKIIQVVLYIAVCIISAYLAWSGYRFCVSQYNFAEDLPSVGIKLWTLQVILPYAFSIVSLRYFIKAVKKIIGIEEQEVQLMI